MPDRPPDRPRRLSLTDAARELGLNREALRSRIRRGLIAAVQEEGRWVVSLTTLPTGADHPASVTDHPVDHPETMPPAELVQLRVQVDLLTREREHLAEENRRLWEQLAARTKAEEELRVLLLNTQRLLPAPPEAAGTVPGAPERPENGPAAAEPVQTAPRRRWAFWRRWRR